MPSVSLDEVRVGDLKDCARLVHAACAATSSTRASSGCGSCRPGGLLGHIGSRRVPPSPAPAPLVRRPTAAFTVWA